MTVKPKNPYKVIYGIAKELSLDNDTLHAMVYEMTKKDSLKKLTDTEMETVIKSLQRMKRTAMKESQRTDTGGEQETKSQRRLIYELTGKLGWNNDNSRIDAFCYRMFRVKSVKDLTPSQASKMIEILKQYTRRIA